MWVWTVVHVIDALHDSSISNSSHDILQGAIWRQVSFIPLDAHNLVTHTTFWRNGDSQGCAVVLGFILSLLPSVS